MPYFLIICGFVDFNFSPDDAAYSLLVGEPLLPAQVDALSFSRVVHFTIDPSVPRTDKKAAKDEEEDGGEPQEGKDEGESEEQDPDRTIVNTRQAGPQDGLLSDDELVQLFNRAPRPISAYDEGLRDYAGVKDTSIDLKEVTFGGRVELGDRRGAFEPIWTSFTHVSVSSDQTV